MVHMAEPSDNAVRQKPKRTLSIGLRYGYGLGEFGFNFLLTYITYYLTLYLTNVAGVSIALAAGITTATTAIKVVGMPIAGTLIDTLRFKHSRFREWMIAGGVIYCVGGTLLFTHIETTPGIYAVLFCIFFFIYWLGYSIAWTAFRALMDKICSTPMDKVGLTAASSQEGAIARMIFSFVAAGILAGFTGADGTVAAVGYTVVNLTFGIICLVCFLLVDRFVKKYDLSPEDDPNSTAGARAASRPKIDKHDFIVTIKTRPMIVFILCAVFRCSVMTAYATLLTYYFIYVIGDNSLVSVYMMVVYAIAFFGALAVRPVAKRIGKRATFVSTTILSGLATAIIAFVGTNGVAFIALMCVFHFFGIFSSTLIPTCMADIGEYNAIVHGSNARGLTFSIGGMAIQLSSVLGAIIATYGMVIVGFDPNAVTKAGVTGLKYLYTFGLAGLSFVSAILFLFYPLTESYMDKLRKEHGLPTAAEQAAAAMAASASQGTDSDAEPEESSSDEDKQDN